MMNKKKLEIYVHIPFCAKKCAYCDFLSFPGNMRMRREYTDKRLEEIRIQSSFVREYQVDTIFLGGGTPSVLDVTDITAIMGTLKEHYDIAPDAEITIEVNPGTVKMEGLVAYRKLESTASAWDFSRRMTRSFAILGESTPTTNS